MIKGSGVNWFISEGCVFFVGAGGEECFAEGGGIAGVEFGVAAGGADGGLERIYDWFFIKGGIRIFEGDELEALVGVETLVADEGIDDQIGGGAFGTLASGFHDLRKRDCRESGREGNYKSVAVFALRLNQSQYRTPARQSQSEARWRVRS